MSSGAGPLAIGRCLFVMSGAGGRMLIVGSIYQRVGRQLEQSKRETATATRNTGEVLATQTQGTR